MFELRTCQNTEQESLCLTFDEYDLTCIISFKKQLVTFADIYIDLYGNCETNFDKGQGGKDQIAYKGEEVFVQTRLNLLGNANCKIK